MLKSAVKNATFTTAGSAANAIIGFLFAGLTIRFLGDQRAGYILALQSLLAFGSAIGGLGFGTAAVRKIAALYSTKDFAKARECLGAVLFVNLIIGIIMAAILITGFSVFLGWSKIDLSFRNDAFYTSVFTATAFIFLQLASGYATIYTAAQRYDIIALLGTIFGFVNGILGLIVLTVFRTMTALALVSVFLTIFQFIINILLVKKILCGWTIPAWNYLELKSMFKFGFWAWVSNFSGVINSSLDKIVLTTFLGSASLPYYVVGQRIVNLVHSFLVTQSQFIFPMLSAEGNQASFTIQKIEDRLRWFIAFVGSVIYGSLNVLSYPLLSTLIGQEFSEKASIPFLLACLQGFFVALTIVPYQISWAEGRGKPNAITTLALSVLSFISIVILAPRYGIIGAGVAQLWVGPVAISLTVWVLLAGNRFSFYSLFRPILSPIIMWLLTFGLWYVLSLLEVHNLVITLMIVFVCIPLFIFISGGIEWKFYKDKGCITTLFSALKIAFARYS